MPLPFNKILSEHTEKQYLELETNYLNLYSFAESLLTITENRDINSDSQRLTHFNALTIRLNEGVSRFQRFTKALRSNLFARNSASSDSEGTYSHDILPIEITDYEGKLIVESLEHISSSYPELKVADDFQELANRIKQERL